MINVQREGPILPRDMFRGKVVMWEDWFAQWRTEYEYLIKQHGYDKFRKVYDYFFRLLSGMKFGQWINVKKTCPDSQQLPLFHFVLEMIYQGDLFSSYTYDTEHGYIYVDTPDKQLLQKLDMFFPDGDHYILNDQYRRWLSDHATDSSSDDDDAYGNTAATVSEASASDSYDNDSD